MSCLEGQAINYDVVFFSEVDDRLRERLQRAIPSALGLGGTCAVEGARRPPVDLYMATLYEPTISRADREAQGATR